MKNTPKPTTYMTSKALILALVLGFSAAGSAQEPLHIGYAANVERIVEGQVGTAASQTIQIEDDIFFSEIITTEPDASAVMSFRDGSSLEIGPNSAVTIDEFIFNPVEGVKTQTITALVGTFRFVSGMAMPNQTVTINTPTATMGIRGSIDIFSVASNGDTAITPTAGTATIAALTDPLNAVSVSQGSGAVLTGGGQPATGPQFNSVARQMANNANQTFGARTPVFTPTPQRQTRDAAANLTPVANQQQTTPTLPSPNAITAAVNARQDQTMDSLGLDSVTQLNDAGVIAAVGAGNGLSQQQQTVVDSTQNATQQLANTLNAALSNANVDSQSAHEAGTRNVIGGLSQNGNAEAVRAATNNASQADPVQAAPAVGAAAANLPNLNANTMSDVLQSAVDGLQAGGNEVNGNTVGSLAATAINNMSAANRQNIGNTVVNTIATNFATQNPGEAANLASTLTSQLTGNAATIARNATQNLANQNPALAQAINTAVNNAAAANARANALAALGQPARNALANAAANASSGPNIETAAVRTGTPVIPAATDGTREPVVPQQSTLHAF